jgi:hypothetical protein
MRGLFRSALGLCAVGLAMIGCGRSGPPAAPGDGPGAAPPEAPYQAAFRVPGMT